MKKSQPEVLIVGAGPVGLLTAIELKRRGIHPRIVDKGMGLRAYSRALNINARSLEILEPSGVAHKLLARGNRLRRTYLVEDGKTTLTLRTEALRHRYPFTLVIPQTVTEMLLYDTVIDLGISNVGMYHTYRPLLKNKNGNIISQDLHNLYYYHNRMDGYELEKYFR